MKNKQAVQSNRLAIVIGASMTGLMMARVLSDHFEQVTIVERDQLPEQVETRKGVPQGPHVHLLLAKGVAILNELFPGLFEVLTQNGALQLTPTDISSCTSGMWNTRFPSSIQLYSQSRPFLEQSMRNLLTTRSNVRLLEACEVTQLLATEDSSRVTGVSLSYRSGEQRKGELKEELIADLVVDASGRRSRAPRWLVSLGYPQVEETSMKLNVGYATRIYRRSSHHPLDWKVLVIGPIPPNNRRAGTISLIEGDHWTVSLVSYQCDYLPDEDSFLDYARGLSQPDIYEAIKEAEPLTPVLTYKYSANRWRHYERMSRFPEGFVILGDAACSFNPVYAQGMTVAALEAKVLDAHLRQYSQSTDKPKNDFAQQLQRAIAKVVEWPWQMAMGADLPYLGGQGRQAWTMRLIEWYIQRVMQLTTSNPLVAERFYQVSNLLKPPMVLLDPRLAWAVLRRELHLGSC